MMDLDSSLTKVVSIEIYEFRISRFDFQPKLMCMCRVTFLITPDIYIYKDYFKGLYISIE